MLNNAQPLPSLDVTALFREPIRNLLTPFEPAIQKAFQFDQLAAHFRTALDRHDASPFENLLALLQVRCRVEPEDLARIPARGPVVAVSNHPFGPLRQRRGGT